MKNILLLTCNLLFLFSYSKNDKKINFPLILSLDSPAVTFDSVYVDLILKQKMDSALVILKEYAKSSSVWQDDFVNTRLRNTTKMAYGNVYFSGDTLKRLEVETFVGRKDLRVFFTDKRENTNSNEVASTIKTNSFTAIVFTKDYVRTHSVVILASVLVHELTHLLMIEHNLLQDSKYEDERELCAYFRQVSFLVYMYGGPPEEILISEEKTFCADVPLEDKPSFYFFFKQVNDLRIKSK